MIAAALTEGGLSQVESRASVLLSLTVARLSSLSPAAVDRVTRVAKRVWHLHTLRLNRVSLSTEPSVLTLSLLPSQASARTGASWAERQAILFLSLLTVSVLHAVSLPSALFQFVQSIYHLAFRLFAAKSRQKYKYQLGLPLLPRKDRCSRVATD